jgi:hypothetical protein
VIHVQVGFWSAILFGSEMMSNSFCLACFFNEMLKRAPNIDASAAPGELERHGFQKLTILKSKGFLRVKLR